MKIAHDQAAKIPAPVLALMIDLGWVSEWPFEIRPAAVRWIRAHGWDGAVARAAETIKRLGKGEYVEAAP